MNNYNNIPITLKSVVLKGGFDVRSQYLFNNISKTFKQ